MPNKTYPLAEGSRKKCKISWIGPWSKVEVFVDDKKVGSTIEKKDIEKGVEFDVDGKKLFVQLKKVWKFMPELMITYDGTILPGSPADPKHWIKQIFWLTVGLGILNILLGLIAWFGQVEILRDMGLGALSTLYGLVFVVLSFGIKKYSYMALGAVVALSIVDLILSAYILVESDGSVSSIIIKIFILMFLVRGFSMIKKIKK